MGHNFEFLTKWEYRLRVLNSEVLRCVYIFRVIHFSLEPPGIPVKFRVFEAHCVSDAQLKIPRVGLSMLIGTNCPKCERVWKSICKFL